MPTVARPEPAPSHTAVPPLRPERRYHFLGIGGVGMSALAELLHRRGFCVSGSDQQESETTRRLTALGIPVCIGHDPRELDAADVVVYSSAIREPHPLRRAALARGLPLMHRGAMLAAVSEGTRLIAVTGTHGKSTTTGALAQVWRACGLNPTGLVGGDVLDWERHNLLPGGGGWTLTEADESDGSFLLLQPDSILLTNAEVDHLDHHGTVERLNETFAELIRRLPAHGTLVYGADDAVSERLGRAHREGAQSNRALSFGLQEQADVRVRVIDMRPGAMRMALRAGGSERELTVRLGGRHNAVNLAGAFAMALAHGLPEAEVLRALAEYRGVARRQEFVGNAHGYAIFDDYAHHPTEIRATLEMFLSIYGAPVSVVFQPHLYSRTRQFAREFAEALRPAARIWVAEVYAAREEPIAGVSGRSIVEHLAGHPAARFVEHWRELPELLAREEGPKEKSQGVLLTLGAGDITGLGPLLIAAPLIGKERR